MRAIDADKLKECIINRNDDCDDTNSILMFNSFLDMVDNQPTIDLEDYVERPEINPSCNGPGHANCEICDSYCPYR